MILYEAINGMIGESYVRCYVWAVNEEIALQMATDKFNENAKRMSRQDKIEVKELLSSDSTTPFVTDVSDSGWDVK